MAYDGSRKYVRSGHISMFPPSSAACIASTVHAAVMMLTRNIIIAARTVDALHAAERASHSLTNMHLLAQCHCRGKHVSRLCVYLAGKHAWAR